jgi:fimbrial chaperone protein
MHAALPPLVAALSAALCGVATAGGFAVSPLRIELAGGRPVAVLQLTNTSDAPLAVQAQPVRWPAGDESAPPLVVNPAVATLAPRQTQTFRIGSLERGPAERERSYRIYFTELPSAQPSGLGVLLRVGVPVFVAPTKPAAQPLQWRLAGADVLEVHNPGNVHHRLTELEVVDASGRRLAQPSMASPYVLAGQTVQLPVGGATLPRGDALRVRGTSAAGPIEQRIE